MYTFAMRSRSNLIGGLAPCLCLLTLQLSGLHMHVDGHGYVGVPEPAHLHSRSLLDRHDVEHSHAAGADHSEHADGAHAHDETYEGARDVSLFDLSLSGAKVPWALLAMVFLFVVAPLAGAFSRTDFVCRVPSGRHARWRPPLRAPPIPA